MKNKFIEFVAVVLVTAVSLFAGIMGIWLENDATMLVFAFLIFVLPVWAGYIKSLVYDDNE